MIGYVVDASLAVEYLLRTQMGRAALPWLTSTALCAPELMDAEVLSVLRRAVLRGLLDESRAREVLQDLAVWPVQRIRHRALVAHAWQYRDNVGAYDSIYVACASLRGMPLLTTDRRLARAAPVDVSIHCFGE